jgi:alkylation response protein AidB-like acyl-CoA dehydrogenase
VDLELSQHQNDLIAAVRRIFSRQAGPDRARELGEGAGAIDRELLDTLKQNGFLDLALDQGSSLLDAVLLVEEAEAAYARAPVAARAIVAPLLLKDSSPAAVGLVSSPRSLVRYAGTCDTYLILDGDEAFAAEAAQVNVEPVPTRWGYPLGRVRAAARSSLGPGSGRVLRTAWQIALAAEMGAQARKAVAVTAKYVTERHQFGRAIGSYQAVAHQLATAAVYAEGTMWMARRAAWDAEDTAFAAAAATYACEAARVVVTTTHQVTGAIGIAREYDLVLSTMRLGFLETELGGAEFHARTLSHERWPAA